MKNRTAFAASWVLAFLLLVPQISPARWMNPNTGRFQTMDSFEGNRTEPLSLHRYLYAEGDPVSRTDPLGFESGTLIERLPVIAIQVTIATMLVYAIANEFRRAGPMPTFDWPEPTTQEPTTEPAPEPPAQPKPVPVPVPFPNPQRLDPDEDLEGDLVVHRMGGKANVALTESEKRLSPPGFSVLVGGTPQEAAWQMRAAYPDATRIHELSKTVGTAQISSIRSIGFDIIPTPSRRLLNHGRLIHQSRTAAPFESKVWLRLLSGVFSDTAVP